MGSAEGSKGQEQDARQRKERQQGIINETAETHTVGLGECGIDEPIQLVLASHVSFGCSERPIPTTSGCGCRRSSFSTDPPRYSVPGSPAREQIRSCFLACMWSRPGSAVCSRHFGSGPIALAQRPCPIWSEGSTAARPSQTLIRSLGSWAELRSTGQRRKNKIRLLRAWCLGRQAPAVAYVCWWAGAAQWHLCFAQQLPST